MARPRKEDGERRSEVLYIRQTPDARAALDEKASRAGLPPTEFARQYLEGAEITALSPSIRASKADAAALLLALDKLTGQTKKVGNNVNQLAASSHRDSAFVAYWREVGALLEGHISQLETLMEQVGQAYDRSHS